MNDSAEVDEYLAAVDASQKPVLNKVRKTIKQLVPDAEELISYGIPAFKYKGKVLIYYAAFKNHMSVFPASDAMIDVVGPDLAKFRVSKGTFQFTIDKPLPDELLKQIVLFRKSSIDK